MRRLFEVNSEPHTGARPSVRLCVGLIKQACGLIKDNKDYRSHFLSSISSIEKSCDGYIVCPVAGGLPNFSHAE